MITCVLDTHKVSRNHTQKSTGTFRRLGNGRMRGTIELALVSSVWLVGGFGSIESRVVVGQKNIYHTVPSHVVAI